MQIAVYMSRPFISLAFVCLSLQRSDVTVLIFIIIIMLCFLENNPDLLSVSLSSLAECKFSQSVRKINLRYATQRNIQKNTLSWWFVPSKAASCSPIYLVTPQFHATSFLLFVPTSSSTPKKWCAPSGQPNRQNVIYFDLTHSVSTALIPNLLFGGQVISSEPTEHRAEEQNDKKLIEQTNYVKWSRVADTLYQFTLQQAHFPLSLCSAAGWALYAQCRWLLLLNIFILLYIVCWRGHTFPLALPLMYLHVNHRVLLGLVHHINTWTSSVVAVARSAAR